MTRNRFIAMIDRHGTAPKAIRRDFMTRLVDQDDLAVAIDHGSMILATCGDTPLSCGEHGALVGTLFARGASSPVAKLDATEQAVILARRGASLSELYWGPYVAFLPRRDGRGLDVVRAPLGELPCYRYEQGGVTFLASDMALLRAYARLDPVVDWGEVLHLLMMRYVQTERTCLVDIDELPGGQRLSLTPSGWSQDTLWSPWTFSDRARQIADPDEAARLLREALLTCVAARAAPFASGLLMLSGGLDSSLMATALQGLPAHVEALNLTTLDAHGDESSYARRVGAALGMPVHFGCRDVTRIDVRRSGAHGLPRPCVRGFLQETARLAGDAIAKSGAQALFNGAGGDNIFCSLQSGAPVADRLLVEGLGVGALHSARDMSELAPASLMAVLSDAIARAWLGKPAFRERPDHALLSSDAIRHGETRQIHPWLITPDGALPGKAMHIRMVTFAQSYVENLDPIADIPLIAPLLSQPLVERCLTIPSWLWLGRGHNRLVARRAFADRLPQDIVMRRSKGAPDSFIAQIFESHRLAIRDILVDGELARRGLIDLPAALALIDQPGPLKGHDFERILEFIDVEAWARSWR